ncbi:GAF domain-containing protein [Salarchaeum japonicum]|uniref:GAF domain-containing protein n=1 Tax=Salarchaeum japonicum TaxID=555573 RepID=A0AAV3T2E8_9EURY|nr:GAF domain-containing protein [Salarchaeum japonicum]
MDADRPDRYARLAAALHDAAGHTPRPYPVPVAESERLRALARYDFSRPTLSAHLDALATAVRESLDADVGFVGVLDADTERFLSVAGADFADIPRADAVCAHGLLADAPVCIPDLSRDVRFPNNPLDGFDPAAYAGAPLTTSDGHRLGMVCVLDADTREFDADDERALSWFADQVVSHVERRGA